MPVMDKSIKVVPPVKTLHSRPSTRMVDVWNSHERLSDEPLPVKGGPVTSVAFSPDGKFFAAAFGAAVLFCDATPGERLAGEPLPVTEGRVHSVAFSPDGKTVAAGYYVYASGYVGGVVLWGLSQPQAAGRRPARRERGSRHECGVQPRFQEHRSRIRRQRWQPRRHLALERGRRRAAGGCPADRQGGQKFITWPSAPTAKPSLPVYSPRLWCCGDKAQPASVCGYEPLQLQRVEATSVAFSPDGKTVAAGYSSPRCGGVVLWDCGARGHCGWGTNHSP